MQTETTHTANDGLPADFDVDAILSGSRYAGLGLAGSRGENLAVDIDLDALMAGSRLASLSPAAREACLSADLDIDVDALVASGFAGRPGRSDLARAA